MKLANKEVVDQFQEGNGYKGRLEASGPPGFVFLSDLMMHLKAALISLIAVAVAQDTPSCNGDYEECYSYWLSYYSGGEATAAMGDYSIGDFSGYSMGDYATYSDYDMSGLLGSLSDLATASLPYTDSFGDASYGYTPTFSITLPSLTPTRGGGAGGLRTDDSADVRSQTGGAQSQQTRGGQSQSQQTGGGHSQQASGGQSQASGGNSQQASGGNSQQTSGGQSQQTSGGQSQQQSAGSSGSNGGSKPTATATVDKSQAPILGVTVLLLLPLTALLV